ncbi:hypothetical protein BD311DRAFT_673417 [Dichomitus squalens]|uniref:Fungal-type protein kinase domain-containing protein n=1 Tax=Dichomitus squalens TaxID=114155 RepID=A0A4Q9MD65_9APHY|nr:hypothetical protein BD311DRAFT_673417 [Dichomitus squalens]
MMKEQRQRVFKHLTEIADLLFAAQQRVFLFMLLVMGRRSRVLRWDRAGVVVTPSFDYYERPELLRDYLWRLSNMGSSALGFDPSATRVLPGDGDFVRMDSAALQDPNDADHTERDLTDEVQEPSTFAYVRAMFGASLASDWPRYRLQVPDGKENRSFLVGKPVFRADGVLGRGTRGYVALDCETNLFVWLKDTWRAAYMIEQREGDVLQKLNQAGVEYIPTLVCHGDILDQDTVTADWWERTQALPSTGKRKREEDIRDDTSHRLFEARLHRDPVAHSGRPLRPHNHYRIVVDEVAMPLKKFRNGRQLASVVRDAIQAHYQASTKLSTPVLHRDISSGNILIYPKVRRIEDGTRLAMMWTGLLVDWELSKPIDNHEASAQATQAERMGTHQFMSVNLLTRPWSPVKISDELESFFHVLVYNSVLYLRSNCDCRSSYIDNDFNDYSGPARAHTCGWKSFAVEIDNWLCTQVPYRSRLLFDSPMDDVLGEIHKCLKAHYKGLNYDLLQAAPPRPKVIHPPISAALKFRPAISIARIRIPDEVRKRLKSKSPRLLTTPRRPRIGNERNRSWTISSSWSTLLGCSGARNGLKTIVSIRLRNALLRRPMRARACLLQPQRSRVTSVGGPPVHRQSVRFTRCTPVATCTSPVVVRMWTSGQWRS